MVHAVTECQVGSSVSAAEVDVAAAFEHARVSVRAHPGDYDRVTTTNQGAANLDIVLGHPLDANFLVLTTQQLLHEHRRIYLSGAKASEQVLVEQHPQHAGGDRLRSGDVAGHEQAERHRIDFWSAQPLASFGVCHQLAEQVGTIGLGVDDVDDESSQLGEALFDLLRRQPRGEQDDVRPSAKCFPARVRYAQQL